LLLALYTAVQPKSFLGTVLSFSVATVIASVTGSVYTVFVLKKFDSKFQHAPDAAFERSLFGDSVVAFIGLLLFGATLAFYARQATQGPAPIHLVALSGGIFVTVPKAFYWSDAEVPIVVWWIWTLLMPVAVAWLISRHIGQGRGASRPTCADTIRRP
jgi:hypothetical protein